MLRRILGDETYCPDVRSKRHFPWALKHTEMTHVDLRELTCRDIWSQRALLQLLS